MEKEIGSIVTGKLANFTILGDNPITCDPMVVKDVSVWGTVHEGRLLPAVGMLKAPVGTPIAPLIAWRGMQGHTPTNVTGASTMAKDVKETIQDAGKATKDAAKKAGEKVKEGADYTAEKAADATKSAGQALKDAGDRLKKSSGT